MKNKQKYTGSKLKNQFTAYLMSFIKGRRLKYMEKNFSRIHAECPLMEWENLADDVSLDEYMDTKRKERLLMDEANNIFPSWHEMENRKLLAAVLLLREDEKKFIYQHVFEERGFDEIGRLNALPAERVKSVYYYAIRKIRKWMGGDL